MHNIVYLLIFLLVYRPIIVIDFIMGSSLLGLSLGLEDVAILLCIVGLLLQCHVRNMIDVFCHLVRVLNFSGYHYYS
jgi:hypothetical protein